MSSGRTIEQQRAMVARLRRACAGGDTDYRKFASFKIFQRMEKDEKADQCR